MKLKTVTVLGANGTMGTNVAGIFASFGNAKVYMIARSLQDAKNAKKKAMFSVRSEAISDNLIPKTYDDIEECLSTSDFIFESVAENIEIKSRIYRKIQKFIKPNTIVGTGTSGLSINKLSEYFNKEQRKMFLGIHMFNPPYLMTLCEVIPSRFTSKNLLNNVTEYLENELYRDVVVVKDEPAFMGNRIGFQFLNEAMILAEKHKKSGGIDYIDAIFGGFTGRSMAPLVTSDFVGLDVHKAIVDNLFVNTNDYENKSFIFPEFAEKLIKENKLGRKTGEGLYRKTLDKNNNKILEVYDIESENYREIKVYDLKFAHKMKKYISNGDYSKAFANLLGDKSEESNICIQLLIKYTLYSLYVNKQIGENINSSDKVMSTGFNWIPPLALIDALNTIDSFKELVIKKISNDLMDHNNINMLFENIEESSYDYRSFLKAK